ncbi:MAG: insulinase family protein, partial [Muribaculaceae bacterium]|nr:insulinase family protein [Muribaculaceae bacterium]
DDVGARDEDPDCTGLAHLFEHLMFGGSVNVPDFDGELAVAGGTSNAWTSADFTNFYDILPAHNIETAFHIESDRMLALGFSERSLEIQKSVVVEEFKQTCLNQPYGDLSHKLMAMLYDRHPYRTPVIGKEPAHIERVTLDYVREFFYHHYAPNNAVLSVVGNVDEETVRRLALKWFGPIPRRDITPHISLTDPYPKRARRLTVHGRVPNTVIVSAVRMGAYGSEDYVAADIITDLLANGKSARFYQNLVLGTPLFTMADACISGYEDSGWLMLQAVPANEEDATIEACIESMWREARKLCDHEAVCEREMERIYNRVETDYMLGNMSYRTRALNLAKAVMHGEEPGAHLCRMKACTPADIERAARNILTAPPVTLVYRPENM